MRELFTTDSIVLAAGSALSGVASKEQILHVVKGRAWVTFAGVSHDYWLAAGSKLKIVPGTLVVVEADEARGALELRIEGKQSVLGSQIRHLAKRFAGGRHAAATAKSPAV
jgi:hypothetical protein